eukprot:UN3261
MTTTLYTPRYAPLPDEALAKGVSSQGGRPHCNPRLAQLEEVNNRPQKQSSRLVLRCHGVNTAVHNDAVKVLVCFCRRALALRNAAGLASAPSSLTPQRARRVPGPAASEDHILCLQVVGPPARGGPAPPQRACKAPARQPSAQYIRAGSAPGIPQSLHQSREAGAQWTAGHLRSRAQARPPQRDWHIGGKHCPTGWHAAPGRASGGSFE